jgi:hypothetical protein
MAHKYDKDDYKNNSNNQKCITNGIKITKLKFWKLDFLVLSVNMKGKYREIFGLNIFT